MKLSSRGRRQSSTTDHLVFNTYREPVILTTSYQLNYQFSKLQNTVYWNHNNIFLLFTILYQKIICTKSHSCVLFSVSFRRIIDGAPPLTSISCLNKYLLDLFFFWVKRSESGRSDWCEKAGCRSHPSPKSSQFGLHLCEWSLKRPQINICCVKVSVNSHWFHSANVFFPSVRVLIWPKIFNNFYLETFGRIKQEKKKSLFGLKKMFDHGLAASFSLWG